MRYASKLTRLRAQMFNPRSGGRPEPRIVVSLIPALEAQSPRAVKHQSSTLDLLLRLHLRVTLGKSDLLLIGLPI